MFFLLQSEERRKRRAGDLAATLLPYWGGEQWESCMAAARQLTRGYLSAGQVGLSGPCKHEK